MKIPYAFSSKSMLRSGLIAALATSFSFCALAQTVPAIQWEKTFGGNNEDFPRSIWQTSDGGYIVGGYSSSPLSGDKSQPSQGNVDFWLVKIDATGNKTWDKTIGGNGFDDFSSLQQTADGGYILGGSSGSGISGDKSQASQGGVDFWIVKLDINGNKIWDKTFGGSLIDGISSLQQTSDGGYILGGSSSSDISGDKSQNSRGYLDFWVIKIDGNGNKVWDKTFGGNAEDNLFEIQQTNDGGYILSGHSGSGMNGEKSQANIGGLDYWIIKLDTSGNKLWDKTFGGNNHDILRSIQQTSNGGYVLGGYSQSGISGDKSEASFGNWDFWVIKVDSSGNKTWDKIFGGNDDDRLYSLKQTSDGGYILGGSSNSPTSGNKTDASKGNRDFWVVKLSPTGTKLWEKSIGGTSGDFLYDLKQTTDGGYILTGESISGNNGDKSQPSQGMFDYWIVKLGPEILGIKEPATTFNLSISPNPSQGKFNLQLTDLKAAKAEVTVTDLLGRKVLQKELPVADQQVSEDITLAAAKGMYVVQVKAGEEVISRKVVVE